MVRFNQRTSYSIRSRQWGQLYVAFFTSCFSLKKSCSFITTCFTTGDAEYTEIRDQIPNSEGLPRLHPLYWFYHLFLVSAFLRVSSASVAGFILLTQIAQVAKAVDTSLMPITPAKVKRIATHNIQILNRKLFRYGFPFQHSLPGPFVYALSTGASTSELGSPVVADAIIRPGDPQSSIFLLHDLPRLDRQPTSLSLV